MDTILEPLFRILDKGVAKHIGPVMVVLVIVLTFSVVAILLTVLLPWYMKYRSWILTTWQFVAGSYLFLKICFHYYLGLTLSPGCPPLECSISEAVKICNKCKGPKPPRTHHCSVCNRCILRMDHHCPWLNNCVGHFNHRHFFLFMVYMWLGTAYLCYFVFPEFWELYFLPNNKPEIYAAIKNASVDRPFVAEDPVHELHRLAIIYMYFLSAGASISVFCLMIWHATLIHAGETSIEAHINKAERKRLKSVGLPYFNPYDFGWRDNWKNALSNPRKNSFWRDVLWFSANPQPGDGINWQTSYRMQLNRYLCQ